MMAAQNGSTTTKLNRSVSERDSTTRILNSSIDHHSESNLTYCEPQRLKKSISEQNVSLSSVTSNLSTAASAMVHALFGDGVGPCWGDFDCSHQRIKGRLYAVTTGILYYSNLIGFERRLSLAFDDLVSITLFRTTSLRMELRNGEVYIFKSFLNREHVLQLLLSLQRLANEKQRSSRENNDQQQSTSQETFFNSSSSNSNSHQRSPSRSPASNDGAYDATTRISHQSSRRNCTSTSNNGISIPRTNSRLQLPLFTDTMTQVSSVERAPTRRRAVSDSLVRCLGLDDEQRPITASLTRTVPITLKKSTENPIQTPLEDGDNSNENGASICDSSDYQPVGRDVVLDAWNEAPQNAILLEEIGIESLRLTCSLNDFYTYFLADGATLSFDRFQREYIHDHNVVVTKWQNDVNSTDHQVRTLSFTHPIKKSSMGMGPTEARTKRQQIMKRFGQYGITFSNTTHVEGIPAADCFSVHDFWKIEADGLNHVVVSVRFAPCFSKRTILRSIIEKSIKKETKDWFVAYTRMIQEALEDRNVNELCPDRGRHDISQKTIPNVHDSYLAINERILWEQRMWLLQSLYPLLIFCTFVLLLILILQCWQTHQTIELLRAEISLLRIENEQSFKHMVAHWSVNSHR